MKVKNEDRATYNVAPTTTDDNAVIAHALRILAARMKAPGQPFTAPQDVKDYCRLKLGGLEYEVFGVLFLDVQNRLICFEEMFRGTLTQTSVYPREVVKAALSHNAAAIVMTHNHPSGSVKPSRADEMLTQTMKTALSLIDVRVLDHIIVSAADALSMAETGLI